MISPAWRKWLAYGSGVGIEIEGPHGSESLHVAAVRVRPRGARVLGGFTIEDFPHQAAGAWGADYNAFLRKLKLRHLVATVLLPRHEMIVRQIALPGVADKDLGAAVQFQLDGLHPYAEDDVAVNWARLAGTSTVLVAIVRRQVIERYAGLFAEAGVKIKSFTCSAAVLHSALRLLNVPPAEVFACEQKDRYVEFYGESPTKPIFSASFDPAEGRAAAMAASELRLDPNTVPRSFAELLRGLSDATGPALPFAAALASACPRLSLPLNLLPAEQRETSSRAPWISAAALGCGLLIVAGALAAFPHYESQRYLRSLDAEIAAIEPTARRAEILDHDTDTARQRTLLLDSVRSHTKADMDVLSELTRILAPPTWVNQLEINANQVTVSGESNQASPLLRVLDDSPLFEKSEFSSPPSRNGNTSTEQFRIRSNREPGK